MTPKAGVKGTFPSFSKVRIKPNSLHFPQSAAARVPADSASARAGRREAGAGDGAEGGRAGRAPLQARGRTPGQGEGARAPQGRRFSQSLVQNAEIPDFKL